MGVWEGKLMEIGTASDIGKSRKINEDSLGYRGTCSSSPTVWAGITQERWPVLWRSRRSSGCQRAGPVSTRNYLAINRANQAILDHAGEYPECRGMGTTIAILHLEGNRARVAHIGDSRVYWWHGGKLHRVTRDHSVVEELLLHGGITQEEADYHPQRNILTRALGIPGKVEAESTEFTTAAGDRILMCTDGLTSMLTDDDIATLLVGMSLPRRLPVGG